MPAPSAVACLSPSFRAKRRDLCRQLLSVGSTPHAVVHYTHKHDGETAAEELDGMAMESRILKAKLLPMMAGPAPDAQQAQQQAVPTSRVIALHNLLPAGQPPDDTLAGEVRDECARFGTVANVRTAFVTQRGGGDPAPPRGNPAVTVAFVRFEAVDAAMAAASHLNGRLFDGRRVSAQAYSEASFNALEWGG